MSTNNNPEPSEIDKKKGETEKAPDWPAFWKEFGIKVLVGTILILMIFLGSVAIFTEKVASLELLPTDIANFPFEPESPPNFTGPTVLVDINIDNKYDSIFSFTPIETKSTKIYFDMDEINESYKTEGFINMLNSLKYEPSKVSKLGGFGLYFRDVMCTMIGWNNTIINGLYGFANKYLPDWLTLVIWPFISTIIYSATMMINYFSCIVSHIINLNDWFASVDEQEGKIIWNLEGGFGIRRFCEMIAYGFFGFFVVFVFAPILITIYSILSPISLQAKYENGENMKFTQFIKDTVKNNVTPIMAVLSYNLLVTTKNTLGSTYTASALLAIIISALFLHIYSKFTDSSSDNSDKSTPVINPIQKSTTMEKVTPTQPVVATKSVTSTQPQLVVTSKVTPKVTPTQEVATKSVTSTQPQVVVTPTQQVATKSVTPISDINKLNLEQKVGGKKRKS